MTHSDLGQIQLQLKNYEAAEEHLREAHELYSECLGEEHATTQQAAEALENVYLLFSERDSESKGRASEDRSSETATKKAVANSCDSAGKACLKKKDYKQAQAHYEQSLKVRIELYGEKPHADVAKSYMGLGLAHKGLKEYQKAIADLKKSLAIRLKVHNTSPHVSVATVYHNLGNVYRASGSYKQAEEKYEQALKLFRSCVDPTDRRVKLVMKNLKLVREQVAKEQTTAV